MMPLVPNEMSERIYTRMTFADFERALKKFGINRARIVAERIDDCVTIVIHIPRMLTFDEYMIIENNVKAIGTVVTYWKLPWWKNWFTKFTCWDRGVTIRPPFHPQCRSILGLNYIHPPKRK